MNIEPIGTIHSCFKEKFGIPRQSGLIKSATATLELLPPYNVQEALRDIGEFSHLWIVFLFHKSLCKTFQPTVRPPRLGGNTRIGVFATRAPFRPNPIGLSVVELRKVNGTKLELAGGDFLDGTPVLDIKPYIPYADSVPDANGSFANTAPEPVNTVKFTAAATAIFQTLEEKDRQLIKDVLSYNPRPAYQDNDPNRVFGTRLCNWEIHWKQDGNHISVESLSRPLT